MIRTLFRRSANRTRRTNGDAEVRAVVPRLEPTLLRYALALRGARPLGGTQLPTAYRNDLREPSPLLDLAARRSASGHGRAVEPIGYRFPGVAWEDEAGRVTIRVAGVPASSVEIAGAIRERGCSADGVDGVRDRRRTGRRGDRGHRERRPRRPLRHRLGLAAETPRLDSLRAVTSDELLPIAGLVAALGVALLLVERGAILRLAGIAATVVGAIPLIDAQAPGLADAVDRSPLLVLAAGVGGLGAFVIGTAAALRWPWLVPIAGLVIALRFPLGNPVRPAHFLLPLYGVLGCGLAALAWSTVRRRATPPDLGPVGIALAAYLVFAAASLSWTFDLDRGVFAMAATYIPLGVLASLTARAARMRPFMVTLPYVQVGLALVLAVVAIWEWFAKTTIVANPKIEIANAYSDLFRVNSLLVDPSLFGRIEVFALLDDHRRRACSGPGAASPSGPPWWHR